MHRAVSGAAGLLLASALALAGCAATDYKPATSTFAAATRDAGQAFDALRSAELAGQLLRTKKRILAGEGIVKFEADDCIADSARCRLVFMDRQGREEELTAT